MQLSRGARKGAGADIEGNRWLKRASWNGCRSKSSLHSKQRLKVNVTTYGQPQVASDAGLRGSLRLTGSWNVTGQEASAMNVKELQNTWDFQNWANNTIWLSLFKGAEKL